MELLALVDIAWDNPEHTSATGTATFAIMGDNGEETNQTVPYTFIASEHPEVLERLARGEFGPVSQH